ncbi:MAG: hypothetical protein N0C90_22070, partial [Candidatus Thiodiazotropha endolucinida]|nr:hypothetical protein [Candidatus Thiodiazotropha taylori]MCW4264043.1 hypothetical protein [Candidatus Thiodiazotropha endolucinida]
MEQLEKGLEQKIAHKVAQVLDKRVNTEMKRISKEVDCKIESVKESMREEFREELDIVKVKVESVSSTSSSNTTHSSKVDKTLNIVIRELPESDHENVKSKVDKLFKEGLHVSNVTCESAERKQSRNINKPGVIVAKMKSHEDKRQIMSRKMTLKNQRQYSNVFIQHDQAQADRVLASNFRNILNAMQSHDLTVRGSRVLRRESRDISRDDDRSASSSLGQDDSPSRDHRNNRGYHDYSRENRSEGRAQGSYDDRRDHGYGNRDGGFKTIRGGGRRS